MVPPAPAPKDRHHGPAKDRDRSEPGQPRARHACRPTGGEQATTPAGGTLPHRRSHAMRRDGTWPPAQRVVPQAISTADGTWPPAQRVVPQAITQGWYLKPSRRDGTWPPAQRVVLGHQHRGWYLRSSSGHVDEYLIATSTVGCTWPPAQWVVLRPLRSSGTSSHATGMVLGHQHSGWYLGHCVVVVPQAMPQGWYTPPAQWVVLSA